ncbi:site-specific DNA-methyltransferase [Burkholderia cenocepacia]|uniref:site-specific DNA-methyltransferase n=1 Tax=Burkholderia cenocepacia TaxID=95486 RepID=UPI00264E3019|nr:site-specific DNA-methyltransferase [Burkholderia cenocepacia]MDN7631036.1 DNA methyltransferase [Burkholderia cenocepacia]
MSTYQLDLFAHVAGAYADSANGELDNESLYASVAVRAGLDPRALEQRTPIGKTGQRHNVVKRAIRWHQQTLKEMGVLAKVAGRRGIWSLSEGAGKQLRNATRNVKLVAFSTDLGIAIFGSNTDVLPGLDEPITLVFTSPPYPLRKARAYGNPTGEQEYVDFICRSLDPLVRNLAPGASVCINLSNDLFEPGSPSRSLYCERLVLALNDRLSLRLMDRLVWQSSKPPGPVQWASIKRVQLNSGYEIILWFSNDPRRVKADNRRVLEPHTEAHQKFVAAGGIQRAAVYGDGAYRHRPGGFSMPTAGRIPRNVISRGTRCTDTLQYRRDAQRLGLPVHGAMMPISIPDFLIRFLTEPDDLVVDPFGGTIKTGKAAEQVGRRWICVELALQYVRAAAERFRTCPGFWIDPSLEAFSGASIV